MTTMNISLPEKMKLWVEDNVRNGKYANSSDYVRDLIRKDQTKSDIIQEVQSLITEGMVSGTSHENVDDIWNRVKPKSSNG